jgi:CRISPR-associated protein Cmr1
VGSLTVIGDRRAQAEWLPSVEDPDELDPDELRREFGDALTRLFGRNVFEGGLPALPVPSLSGSTLLIGNHFRRERPQQAWQEALGWLRDFRQQPDFAREPGRPPGRSRWPEADKLRHITGRLGHPPRYTDRTPAWPRAEFGLPIVGRFQGQGEPPDFQLTWQSDERPRDPQERIKDRMASPLIVKALPTLQGFRPCALWLARTNPPGEVVAMERDERAGRVMPIPGSNARFGFTGTPADQRKAIELRAPLARKPSVRDAFLDWVRGREGVEQIAP